MLDVLLILFGLFAIIKGEFRITNDRKVRGEISRSLGVLMLASVVLSVFLPRYSLILMGGSLIVTIIVGLASAKKADSPAENPD